MKEYLRQETDYLESETEQLERSRQELFLETESRIELNIAKQTIVTIVFFLRPDLGFNPLSFLPFLPNITKQTIVTIVLCHVELLDLEIKHLRVSWPMQLVFVYFFSF